jgi:hypothetical protein
MGEWYQNGFYEDWLGVWSGFNCLRTETGSGLCEYGDETSGSGSTETVCTVQKTQNFSVAKIS